MHIIEFFIIVYKNIYSYKKMFCNDLRKQIEERKRKTKKEKERKRQEQERKKKIKEENARKSAEIHAAHSAKEKAERERRKAYEKGRRERRKNNFEAKIRPCTSLSSDKLMSGIFLGAFEAPAV
jgi:membrane protein involved in colicin uptake